MSGGNEMLPVPEAVISVAALCAAGALAVLTANTASRQMKVRFIIRVWSTAGTVHPSRLDEEEKLQLMAIAAWILLGVVLGFVARWIVPGEASVPTIADISAGVLGSSIGGGLYVVLGGTGAIVNLPGLVCAMIGAIVLLRVVRMIRGRWAA
jgi:uncharacterized membrane protein YeaQ/YmgE (transglycosylase-associated protein family)